MATYTGSIFSNSDVVLDGNEYRNCVFQNCRLIFRGQRLPSLNDNTILNSGFVFEGPAQETLNFIRSFANPNSGLNEVFKQYFPELSVTPRQNPIGRDDPVPLTEMGVKSGIAKSQNASIKSSVAFEGRIFPAAVRVSTSQNPEISWFDSLTGIQFKFRVAIQNNTIRVDCDLDRDFAERYMQATYIRAFDLARATVDLMSFKTGFGLTVVFETFTNASGEVSQLIFPNPNLSKLCTVFDLAPATSRETNSLEATLLVVLLDWRIFRCLRMLVENISYHHETAVNCARAIEGLRELLVTSKNSRPEAWKTMRERLNLSIPYLKLITDVSTGPRHGEQKHIPGNVTSEIMTRSWTIMNRFLELKKRKLSTLPTSKFPLL
jgi:hypothetical protein